MAFWAGFWLVVFAAVLLVFAAMSLWVIVGGFKELRAWFHQLDQEHLLEKEGKSNHES